LVSRQSRSRRGKRWNDFGNAQSRKHDVNHESWDPEAARGELLPASEYEPLSGDPGETREGQRNHYQTQPLAEGEQARYEHDRHHQTLDSESWAEPSHGRHIMLDRRI
jgi:hypothetical protein